MLNLNRNTLSISLLLVGQVLSLGCSKDSGQGNSTSGSYVYSENNCTTGTHNYSSQAEFCQMLSDDSLNNDCAADQRMQDLSDRCPASSPPAPLPPPLVPIVKPPPSDATLSCFDVTLLPVKGPEVAFQDFIDGGPGVYRLVKFNGMTSGKLGDKEESASIYTTADTTENLNTPKVAGLVTCKNLTQTPTGELNGYFHAPITIDRAVGTLTGSVDTTFTAEGNPQASDSFSTSRNVNFSVASLQELKRQLASSNQELHIYKVDATTFQLVTTGRTTENGETLAVRLSAIYVLQSTATPVTPAPAPTSPSAQVADAIANVCGEYSDVSNQVNCLLKFKAIAPPLAVFPICSQYSDVSNEVNCLLKLADFSPSPGEMSTCSQYSDVSNQVNCLLKFKP
jgi:hypothetical protein